MNRLRWFLLLGLCALWMWQAPGVAAAAAEGEGWGWWETIGRWFNLALLFGVIIYAARIPAREYFARRRQEIQREILEARQAREDAERRLAEIEARMNNLDVELEKLRQQADQEAAAERERILEQARRDAEKIRASAGREIEGIGRTVRKQLREYAAELAVELAEDRIRSKMGEPEQRRLAEKFFNGLESRAGGLQ